MKLWKINGYEIFFKNIIKVSEISLKKNISEEEKELYYLKYYDIPKKEGMRRIYAVNKKSELYNIQVNICKNFLNNIMLTDSTCGFRSDYCYNDFLMPHVSFYKDNFYLRLDIKDFFGMIKYSLLEDVLDYYFQQSENLKYEQKKKLLQYTLDIITYKEKIVQGAVTSPIISNIIFRQLDLRIEKYCRFLDVEYTRYADDLLFSSKSKIIHSKGFFERINEILKSRGFEINHSKIIRAEKEMSLNGYVISDSIRFSRKKLENISRVVFYLENNDLKKNKNFIDDLNKIIKLQTVNSSTHFNGKYSLINYLAGNRSFLISMLKYSNNNKFCEKANKLVARIEKMILKLN